MGKIWGAVLAALLSSAAAHADWRRAEGEHFVVYSEADEASVRDAVVRLEKLDALQRLLAGGFSRRAPLKPIVYLLADDPAVIRTMPWPVFGVAGYYIASLHGPFAVNTRTDAKSIGFPAQQVLFHELTHHFMLQYFPAAYPPWYREGFADFVGATQFLPDGTAKVGVPVGNRYYSLQGMRSYSWIGMEKLLGAKSSGDLPGRFDLMYAEGWLLTHYLTIQPGRHGQLARYLAAINAGKPLLAAAREAFGDLDKLNRELREYAKLQKLDAKIVPLTLPPASAIAVTTVAPAQAALMMDDIRLHAGVPQMAIKPFADSVRKTAARFPADPVALRLRVEADRLAGETDDRSAAIDAWKNAAPADPALLLEIALFERDRLMAAKSKDAAAWDRVRLGIRAALRRDRQNVMALKALADSYGEQGIEPSVEAHNALFMALEIIPQEEELRYALALDFEHRGMKADAIATIAPIAYIDEDVVTNDAERHRAAKNRVTYRLAGTTPHETPREMFERLQPPAPR